MTAKETREAFYDEHIAPELLRLGQLCQDNGLSFLTMVEWSPVGFGRSLSLREGSSFAIRLAEAATKAAGNIDSLFIALERYAREHGHSSLYMAQLGVPTSPAPAPGETVQ